MDIIILPAVVQGADAAASIAARIREVNEFLLADVMIVGRGGGSIEDLLPFSEECVIEAIHESVIPVISAVGHEIDWAISDYVADLRAPTPSAAAELVCESSLDQMEKVNQLRSSMYDALYKNQDDNPTLGIILCSQKSEAIVKYSVLNEGKQIFASRYKLYLPTEEEFKNMLESI